MPQKPRSLRAPALRAPELRPSAHGRGYGRRWERLRLMVLARQPFCNACDRGEPGVHVDHIYPKELGGSDDFGNLQALCAACHGRKTALYDGGFGRPRALQIETRRGRLGGNPHNLEAADDGNPVACLDRREEE